MPISFLSTGPVRASDTPAFTMLQSASVPVRASKPLRVFFVLAMTMFVFVGDLAYVLKDYILGKN